MTDERPVAYKHLVEFLDKLELDPAFVLRIEIEPQEIRVTEWVPGEIFHRQVKTIPLRSIIVEEDRG